MDIDAYLERRNKALRALDENFVEEMVPTAPVEMRLLILHKARYDCTVIEADLRHESGRWLRAGGHTQMTGEPILPDGELPV